MVEAAAMVAVRPRFPVAHAAVAAAIIEGYLRFLGGPFAGLQRRNPPRNRRPAPAYPICVRYRTYRSGNEFYNLLPGCVY
jgi:hypothetical protein